MAGVIHRVADGCRTDSTATIDTRLPSMVSATTPRRVVTLSIVFLVLCFGLPYVLDVVLAADHAAGGDLLGGRPSDSACSSDVSGCSRCVRWCSS